MSPARGVAVEIVAVYPSLLQAPGDRGNAEVLVQRLSWRGHRPRLRLVDHDQPLPDDGQIYLLGGGEGPAQVAAAHLLAADGALRRVVALGAAVFATGGGYQLLGRTFAAPDGSRIDGLGLLDVETVPGTEQARGEVLGRLRDLPGDLSRQTSPAPGGGAEDPVDVDQATSDLRVITGFEDHAGVTHLGPGADPLAMISVGFGNCGDGTEGAVTGSTLGTNLHGPVLARNPGLADHLIGLALGRPVRALVRTEVDEVRRARILIAMRMSKRS
jgi:lipid II isoglutaminyl synthase (glutamine-hydrolysing)